MAKDGLTGTPFEKPACPEPAASGEGTLDAMLGGNTETDMPKETPNMSGLGLLPQRVDVKDGPKSWSHVDVEPGVASPAVPVTDMEAGVGGGKKR